MRTKANNILTNMVTGVLFLQIYSKMQFAPYQNIHGFLQVLKKFVCMGRQTNYLFEVELVCDNWPKRYIFKKVITVDFYKTWLAAACSCHRWIQASYFSTPFSSHYAILGGEFQIGPKIAQNEKKYDFETFHVVLVTKITRFEP